MIHIYDRVGMARALTLDLQPRLRELLAERIAVLDTEYGDLTDWTEILVVEPADTDKDIIRHIGFSPLVEPIDGARFGEQRFRPHWDWLVDLGGYSR